MIYRHEEEFTRTIDDMKLDIDIEWIKEDADAKTTRDLTDRGFSERYKYEAKIFSDVIDEMCPIIVTTINDEQEEVTPKILELGSGPGALAQHIMEYSPQIELYNMIDGPGAVEVHKIRKYKGNIIAIDMMNGLDIGDFPDEWCGIGYNCVIINDFLEHILNPSSILRAVHCLMLDTSKLIISVPNWRMGHSFFYPGLFDYDNFMKFLKLHKFNPIKIFGSNMKTINYPKLECESALPNELLESWNWYIICEKQND